MPFASAKYTPAARARAQIIDELDGVPTHNVQRRRLARRLARRVLGFISPDYAKFYVIYMLCMNKEVGRPSAIPMACHMMICAV